MLETLQPGVLLMMKFCLLEDVNFQDEQDCLDLEYFRFDFQPIQK
jgi:hypothetical protein